jgi:hypothetical protein
MTPRVALRGVSELDTEALFFVSYEGLVNCAAYQQSAILSHGGRQYAAWYTASRNAVVAHRDLPDGTWQPVMLPHRLQADDSHNSISLGVSVADRRLHVAMDAHDTPIHYTWLPLDGGSGAPVTRSLVGITYPRFVSTSDGWLQLSYRTGQSGNGTTELASYDAGRWRRLGRWSSASGRYRRNGATSDRRNLYLHGLRYDAAGRLHAAFTWREGDPAVLSAPGGLANHDTGYVYSDDRGRVWRNGSGEVVAVTGSQPQVSVGSPGLVVDPLDVDHALMNQESLAVDSAGRPHVVISYVPGPVTDFVADRRADGRVFHLYAGDDGRWHKTEVPVPLRAFGRSQLVLDGADNAYLVMPYGRIVTASASSCWTDWTLRFEGLDAFGEVLVDSARATAEGILSVLYQRTSTGRVPSPLRVADFYIGHS